MVLVVSIIFSICWFTDTVMFLLSNYSTTNNPSDAVWAIGFIMVLFSSAANPFVYALISQRFREKIKRMLCCKGLLSTIEIRPTSEVPNVHAATTITQWIQLENKMHASSEGQMKAMLCSTGLCSMNVDTNINSPSGEAQDIDAATNIHEFHTEEMFPKE